MCVLTHFIMNCMSYCINSLVNHVSDSELRCVSVLAGERLNVFSSITHSLIFGCTLKHTETEEHDILASAITINDTYFLFCQTLLLMTLQMASLLYLLSSV